MKEDFLHYLWRMKRFDMEALQTTQGEPLEITGFGELNDNAGPDFSNARIRIAETLWAGNVEMHLKSSEWFQHRHQEDKAYNNVILHVVLEEDQSVFRENGERIPCLELKNRIATKLVKTYQKLKHNECWIPCRNQFHSVEQITVNLWLDRLMAERLEQKTGLIAKTLEANQGDWEGCFYQLLARNFGVKVNAEPFETLARTISLKKIRKHKSSLFQIEALLFGQAGLLSGQFEDDYPRRLKKEYGFLQKKYRLHPLAEESWKFLRLRPANFPTIRIAQFAGLLYQSAHLFSKVLAAERVAEIVNMFEVKLSNYWQTHYVFDKASPKRSKALGQNTIHLIIINTIAPLLFIYGKRKAEERFQDKALRFLEGLKPEKNSIISKWNELGVEPLTAYHTQALLQLKNAYCDKRKCLQCAIGAEVLK